MITVAGVITSCNKDSVDPNLPVLKLHPVNVTGKGANAWTGDEIITRKRLAAADAATARTAQGRPALAGPGPASVDLSARDAAPRRLGAPAQAGARRLG